MPSNDKWSSPRKPDVSFTAFITVCHTFICTSFFFPLFPFSICYNVIRFVSIICINLTIHPYSLLLGLQTGTTVMEMSVENSQKRLKTDLSHYPATPPLSIYPKTAYSIDTFSAIFSAALDTAAMKQKQPNCLSTDEWIIKPQHI